MIKSGKRKLKKSLRGKDVIERKAANEIDSISPLPKNTFSKNPKSSIHFPKSIRYPELVCVSILRLPYS
ncbi:hypothetical protein BofuT4_P066660.1 [Botrytis cinerea T4]|uniref:Uncharacterized protein n=1 Tax=Botryotinia fuckeliana (strain T4) TaxID=999810 RepID=G2XRP5_BOTF4|nr:hypothetical protein BofuT4_P066660.1 [Botrytis cinerea T4]